MQGPELTPQSKKMSRTKKFMIAFGVLMAIGAADQIYVKLFPEVALERAEEKLAQERKRALEEALAEAKRIEQCEKDRNMTPERWERMSSMLRNTIPTECRPPFAPARTAKNILKDAARSNSFVLDQAKKKADEMMNKEF